MTTKYKLNLTEDQDLTKILTNNKARLSDHMNNHFRDSHFTKESFFGEGIDFVMWSSDFGNKDEKSAKTTVNFEWSYKEKSGQIEEL